MPDRFQQLVGALAMILVGPLLGVLAILVKIDSPGPAFYRGARVGEGGRLFACLKLRTMLPDPDSDGSGITIDGDVRITRIGRFLRRFRLDELPQLVNVARGEMNLVGPRPEDPRFVDFADPAHRSVFFAKPGITGLAQLTFIDEARSLGTDPVLAERRYRELILPRKLAIDEKYLRERSWRTDLSILAATLKAVRRGAGDGARRGPSPT